MTSKNMQTEFDLKTADSVNEVQQLTINQIDQVFDEIFFGDHKEYVQAEVKICLPDDIKKRVSDLMREGKERVEGKKTDRCWVMSEILTQIKKEMGNDAKAQARTYILKLCNIEEIRSAEWEDD